LDLEQKGQERDGEKFDGKENGRGVDEDEASCFVASETKVRQ
jgi:hypothetical protein